MIKKLGLTLVFGVLFISACSAEISPQEKKNNFDLCVINYIDRNTNAFTNNREFIENREAPRACKKELK
jgi:hypothetical protein